MALFTVIEGADCCGKTTQVEMLVKQLEQVDLNVVKMSFPRYGTPFGKAISRHLHGEIRLIDLQGDKPAEEDDLAFQALQTMDKYEAAATIEEHLKGQSNVVSSRWWQSAMIYGTDMGLDRNMLHRVHARLPQADLNILIHLPEEETLARRPDLRDRLEKDRTRQKRVRDSYRQMWSEHGAGLGVLDLKPDRGANYWLVVDGRESESKVHHWIWQAFLGVLQSRGEVQRG